MNRIKTLLSKNNVVYMLIILIGFFWCGSVYLTQEQYISKFMPAQLVNIVVVGIGSISMALGMILFSFLYKKNLNIKRIYLIFLAICLILTGLFFFVNNSNLMMIIINILCIIGAAGFGTGYHFALLAKNVEKEYCGRIFALAYAFGTIGTWLLTKIPKLNLFTSINCLYVYIPLIVLNIVLIYKYGDLKNDEDRKNNTNTPINKKLFNTPMLILYVMIGIMAIMSSYGSSILDNEMAGRVIEITLSRVYYAFGLVIAGIIADKSKKVFEITTIVSLIYPLCACIFLNEGFETNIVYSVYYLSLGFFTVFRTITLVRIAKKDKQYIGNVADGLLITRIIEAILTFIAGYLINNYILTIMIILITFITIVLYYFLYYDKKINIITYRTLPIPKDSKDLLNEFCIKYEITKREKEIIENLIQNYTNQEIADKLFISLGTVKNTTSRIYKKTGMSKNEIKKYILKL